MKRKKLFNFKSVTWFTLKVVTWLTVAFKLELARPPKDFLEVVNTLETLERCNGPIHLTKYVKGARLSLSRYLSGTPFTSKEVEGVRLSKDGIPVILGPWIPLLRSQVLISDDLKLIMTILNMTRALNLGKEPDLDPITKASTYVLPDDLEAKVFLFWKELGYNRITRSIPKRALWSNFHQTSKVSPYIRDPFTNLSEKNALWHSLSDLRTIPPSLLKSIKKVGGPLLESKIDTLFEAFDKIPEISKWLWTSPSNNFRKLSYFPDKELKMRVVAIGDYWSQTALRPLHLYLFGILRRIPQDMTFKQGRFKEDTKVYPVYYSFDLTAATDRFPIKLISAVLRGRFQGDYVKAWEDIMVGYPFRCPQNEDRRIPVYDREASWLSYSVGNPMGFYSSWSSFTLAHHFVMFYCCDKLGIKFSDAPYYLLGDDIVICDKDLALCYKEMISSLDIQISEPKSFVSPHFFEFAKRLFWRGVEITPFPISSMKESLRNITNFVAMLLETEDKGWITCSTPSEAIALAYGVILSYRSKFRTKLEKKAFVTDRVLRSIRGSLPTGQAVEACFSKLGYPLGPISDKVGNSILENIVVDLFSQTPEMAPIDPKSPSSFELAARLVMELTGLDEERLPLGFETIYALPVTQVQGQIEETYMSLTRKAREISTTTGEWGLLFRSLALPVGDSIFSERSAKSVTRVSGKVGDQLAERGMILQMYPSMLREKHTLSSSHIKVPLGTPSNPYLDYKIRLVREFLTFLLKFLLGILAGMVGIALIVYYIDHVPLVVNLPEPTLISEVDPPKGGEYGVTDTVRTSVLIIEGVILIGLVSTVALPVILPVVPIIASQILNEISPFLQLGFFS